MFGATFGIVAQGLEIFRKSMDIRNKNVLNANNPDYAQEEPVINSFAPAGIVLEDIRRAQSFYYMSLRNQKLSLVSALDTTMRGNSRIEDLFQEFTQGLGGSEYISMFFSSYQNLMKEPTNEGAKGELKNSARSLLSYLKDRRRDLDRALDSIDYDMRQYVDRVNNLTKKIANINQEILIAHAQTYARGKDYKNLLDERDKYLRELSDYININVQEDEIGRVRVETSKGFVLVEERYSWNLRYDGGSNKIYWVSKDNADVDITNLIEGGRIRGLLEFSSDLRNYTSQLEGLARKLISEVKLPLNAQTTNSWYWFRNVNDPNAPLGLSGIITFNIGNSTLTLNYTSTDSLNNIITAINTDPAINQYFTANLVNNPDGTHTMLINPQNPNYTIEDSNGLIHRSEPLFVGTGINDIDLNPNLNTYIQNLEYEKADEFNDFSRGWWDGAKSLYANLVNHLASRQWDLKKKHEIESSLLKSIDAKVQELQGVSIDEEFIELMKLQRSYEAIAMVVNRLDEMLKATLNMV
ncbi:MAG: flagellar hook-associated protein FlgK [Acidobacteria bacterium]|jgi:flagellar hook-associated protein 1 FlgK|nr:MAG: flagellar hook-associated protein FlgK [Acidobacteriota bacterium]